MHSNDVNKPDIVIVYSFLFQITLKIESAPCISISNICTQKCL